MNLELTTALSGVFISVIAFVFAFVCYGKFRTNRELIEFTFAQIEKLEASLAERDEKIELVTKRAADQSRRVAWLETRIRQPKLMKKDILEETIISEVPKAEAKANITERRHRVLALAKNGQNTEMIAETLGIFPGEVDLIINLNRANFAQFA